MCIVSGLQKHLTAKREAAFTIEAIDADGRRKHTGGEAFFIAIRGASRVRARVTDHQDGTYSAEWTPQCSGDYHVAVSLFGVSLKGSPFSVHVQGPEPFAPNCEVSSSSRSDISKQQPQPQPQQPQQRCGRMSSSPLPPRLLSFRSAATRYTRSLRAPIGRLM